MPTMKIAMSDIALGPRCLSEVVSRREDRWNPDPHENARLLAGAHANAEPKGDRKEERQESRRKYEPISLGEHFYLPPLLQIFLPCAK